MVKFMASTWEPLTLEDWGDKPVTFNTKQELKDACKATGKTCGALL